jgi:putative transposase
MSDSTKKGRKHHTAEQVIAKLREASAMLASGQSLAQVIQSLGVSEATYHRWKDQYGGMRSGEAKRLKDLEQENARLKSLVADLSLDKAILKEALDHLGKQ